MVMMFRFLLAWLTHRLRGPLGVLDTGVLSMRVWPTDLDMNVHMNNGRYFTAADIGRLDWWLRTGVMKKALARGWGPVAGDANGRFSRSLQPFEKFAVHTRLIGWDSKWLFKEHRFVSQSGQVVAVIVVRYLFRSRKAQHSPAEVLALVGHREPSPPLPDWVRDWHRAQNELTASLKAARARG
ncbi:MAG TPA: thioesterase family protein [Nevskiales bacterium]|nr:thioesterase family protein [Nevskiales bacterium]